MFLTIRNTAIDIIIFLYIQCIYYNGLSIYSLDNLYTHFNVMSLFPKNDIIKYQLFVI